MNFIIYTTFFLIGSVVGSFLNVVIFRFGAKSFVSGRSACLYCKHHLAWYEMIPIISYFALRGRCKVCKSKISFQYPLVEFLTGVIFLALFVRFENLFFIDTLNFTFVHAFYSLLFSILIIIAVYDLKHKIIPDILSFVFGALSFLGMFIFVNGYFFLHIPRFSDFLAGLAISLPFAMLWFFSKGKWMGFGDAKLAVGLGFMLGLAKLLSAVTIAFWVGSIVGIVLILLKKVKGLQSEIPFAPFLILGTLLAFFFDLNLFSLF